MSSMIAADQGMLRRYVEGSLWGESVANFYSPLESPEDSGDEIEEGTLVRIPRRFKVGSRYGVVVSLGRP